MDLVPLRITSSDSAVFVNRTSESQTVLLWAAAHGGDGQIAICRPKDEPTNPIDVSADASPLSMKLEVTAKEAIMVLPGKNGTMAVRVATEGG